MTPEQAQQLCLVAGIILGLLFSHMWRVWLQELRAKWHEEKEEYMRRKEAERGREFLRESRLGQCR